MSAQKTIRLLQRHESRNITFIEEDGSWPMVWDRARGVHVWDGEGNRYLDLTAAFGVASAGHANPSVVRAARRQMGRLLHAMGDVHPHALKAELARELSRLTYERWHARCAAPGGGSRDGAPLKRCGPHGKVIFGCSGFEAVESALKTAILGTGRRHIIAFEGGYHGLGYGALNATHREHFWGPFRRQLGRFGSFAPFPEGKGELPRLEKQLSRIFRTKAVGAVLVEPVQARGGIRVPPVGFLPMLRRLCDEHGALLVADEIYTGFGRTGKWFACEHSGVIPDLICLGKALTGGFPVSACVGSADLMDRAWPLSEGEAVHTSTYLGHPVGCAMALAQIREIKRRKLVERSSDVGAFLLAALAAIRPGRSSVSCRARGLGLMAGLELTLPGSRPATKESLAAIKELLHQGYIFLPEGEHANVIGFTPPLTITRGQISGAVAALRRVLERV